jgi:hypothetical protein
MTNLMISMFAAAGLALAASSPAQATPTGTDAAPMTKDGSTSMKPGAAAQQKLDLDACTPMTGAPKDKCVTQANAAAKINLAKEEAAAAVAKCDGMSDAENAKCVKDAQRK